MNPSAAPDHAVYMNDSGYPGLLREISSPPDPLHLAGTFSGQPYVAIVGSRACSRYGREVAYELAAAGVGCVAAHDVRASQHDRHRQR